MSRKLLLAIWPMLGLACIGSARAAVTEADFHLQTTQNLVNLCSASANDPMATAAANFCQGFALGVYQTVSEEQLAMRNKLFCMPEPTPSRNQAVARFVAWANANPSVMNERPADAIVDYLTSTYRCTGR